VSGFDQKVKDLRVQYQACKRQGFNARAQMLNEKIQRAYEMNAAVNAGYVNADKLADAATEAYGKAYELKIELEKFLSKS
jgi:hypothetical protein